MRKLLTNFRWHEDGSKQQMLVDHGKVVWRGQTGEIPKDAEVEDLGGQTLAPAFIDAHCHILPSGLDLQKPSLYGLESPEAVLDRLRDALAGVPKGQWLLAIQYDPTRFPEGQKVLRHDLDQLSETVPILVRFSSGHASVANTAALAAARVGKDPKDPSGGSFGRDASGELTGELFETASEEVTAAAPRIELQRMVEAILLAGDEMAKLGIASASDMMTGYRDVLQEIRAYRLAAEAGLKIKTRLYLQWSSFFGPKAADRLALEEAIAGLDGVQCRVAGIKIFADGAIGSGTAAIYGRYADEEAGGPILSRHAKDAGEFREGVSGQLIYNPAKLRMMVATASDLGFQVSVHSIGDYSTDLVLDAFETTGAASRHRIEHAMLLSDRQIERMAGLGCHCCMQPEFLAHFRHAYHRRLGEERASKLIRVRSLIDAGVAVSFSSDRPIVPGDPKVGLQVATEREGYDPSEKITELEAMRAYTEMAAHASNDGDLMGRLAPGQLADYQLLRKDA